VARPRRQTNSDTATRILDVAERLVQRRGFNGFSYADVAAELGITTASLHYHYAGKADLGQALIDRYAARFMAALADLDARFPNIDDRLQGYAGLYGDVLRKHRLCLCGMLAAEYQTLPKPMRAAVVRFFDQNEAWLGGVLEVGREQGSLRFVGDTEDIARMIVSSLEGAMLVARPYGDNGRFQSAATQLIASLAGPVAVAK
jgi:TetR/AcrR family transcriptional regulator, transcriptional repressor for nem operon